MIRPNDDWMEPERQRRQRLLLLTFGCLTGVAIFLLLYLPALSLGFVSDDYFLLSLDGGWEAFVPLNWWYRYSPLGVLLLATLKDIFGLTPYWFHLLFITLHAANTLLVGLLAYRIILRIPAAIAAALLFMTFSLNYEAVYWAAASAFYLPMTFLTLTACNLVVSRRWRHEGGKIGILVLTACYAGAALFHEMGLALLPLILIIDRRIGAKGLVRRFFPLIVVAITIVAVKQFATAGLVIAQQSPAQRIANFALAHLSLLWPYDVSLGRVPDLMASLPLPVLCLICALLVALSLGLMTTEKARNVGMLLLLLQISILPFTTLSGIQSRYFYLPSIFSSLLIASFFDLAIRTSPVRFRRSLVVFASVLFLLCQVAQLRFLHTRLGEWQDASDLANQILDETSEIVHLEAKSRSYSRIVMLNVPGSIGDPKWPAYVFLNAFPTAVRLLFESQETLHPDVVMLRDVYESRASISHSPVQSRKIRQMIRGGDDLVLLFDHDRKSIRQLN